MLPLLFPKKFLGAEKSSPNAKLLPNLITATVVLSTNRRTLQNGNYKDKTVQISGIGVAREY